MRIRCVCQRAWTLEAHFSDSVPYVSLYPDLAPGLTTRTPCLNAVIESGVGRDNEAQRCIAAHPEQFHDVRTRSTDNDLAVDFL